MRWTAGCADAPSERKGANCILCFETTSRSRAQFILLRIRTNGPLDGELASLDLLHRHAAGGQRFYQGRCMCSFGSLDVTPRGISTILPGLSEAKSALAGPIPMASLSDGPLAQRISSLRMQPCQSLAFSHPNVCSESSRPSSKMRTHVLGTVWLGLVAARCLAVTVTINRTPSHSVPSTLCASCGCFLIDSPDLSRRQMGRCSKCVSIWPKCLVHA